MESASRDQSHKEVCRKRNFYTTASGSDFSFFQQTFQRLAQLLFVHQLGSCLKSDMAAISTSSHTLNRVVPDARSALA
eukprot:795256-Pleurochrysis_carterae.AAC.2